MKWFLTLILFFCLAFVAIADGIAGKEIRSGDILPTFSVQSNTGKTFSTSTLNGKPALIVFFHTKCLDCKKELPVIQEFYEEYGARIEFIAISRAQSQADIEEFWQSNHLTIPYAAQEDKTIFKLFAKKTIPRVYLCDGTGEIQKTFKERFRKRSLQRAINKILDEKSNIIK